MHYGYDYISFNIPDELLSQHILEIEDDQKYSFVKGEVSNEKELVSETNEEIRKTNIKWVTDNHLLNRLLMQFCMTANVRSGWNVKISGIEPVQYGVYEDGGHYKWHVDQHKKLISNPMDGLPVCRKISMSLFLNDPNEYEGGEFDLEIESPDSENRYRTFKLEKNTALFFKSHTYHRVRPVTSGIRKSIVAWFVGPPYV